MTSTVCYCSKRESNAACVVSNVPDGDGGGNHLCMGV